MVPYCDNFNHEVGQKQLAWAYDDDEDGLNVTALVDIPAASTLSISYGDKCNSRFFLNYGFVNEHNDANEYSLMLTINYCEDAGSD